MSTWKLTEEQALVQQMLRAYCDDRIAPQLDALEDGEVLPYAIMRDMADTFGLREMFPASREEREGDEEGAEERGERSGGGLFGPGSDPMLGHIVMMELSRVSPGLALSFGASLGLAGGTILARGTRAQRRKWATPLFRLDAIGAWGLTEPAAGSDAFGSMQTRARRVEGGWMLNGQKTFITNAPYADVLVIYARLQRDGEGPGPVGAFVVAGDAPGVSLGPCMEKMGMRESPTGEIFLEEVFVPADQLLGGDPDDPESKRARSSRGQAKNTLNAERSAMPAMAAGMVQRCLEICVQYAREREQFGRPIGDFQAVQLRLARIYMIRETILSWVLRLAEAERDGSGSATLSSAAKLYCGQACVDACLEAIQVLGGYGYMREGRVEKLMRDAKLLQIGGGTDDIQMTRIARALLHGR